MKNRTLSAPVALWVAWSVAPCLLAQDRPSASPAQPGLSDAPSVPWLVCDPATWKRVPDAAWSPAGGVTVADDGLFKPVMDGAITYLQTDFNEDDMLLTFRKSNGVTDPPGRLRGWDKSFPCSPATFLLGVGHFLRWREHADLRRKMDQLIAGLMACGTPEDGLKVPYGGGAQGYSLTLFAHGLEAAAKAGNRDAWKLLRAVSLAYRKELDAAVDRNPNWGFRHNQNHFGVSACMVMHFGQGGTDDDLLAAMKHTHMGWMNLLIERNPNGVCKIPISYNHSAETYGFVGYLDLYRATGDRRMLDAMRGAWELFHDQWEHPGGTQAICENEPPGAYASRSLRFTPAAHTGELCSNVWWVKLNQKFHQLFPMEEKYADEIEKCIYNVALADVDDRGGSRYHTHLEGKKDKVTHVLSCCEVLGTYLYNSLPEHIYSIAEDGLYVNLYEPSSIAWRRGGRPCVLTMASRFPFKPEISLRVDVAEPTAMTLRIRVPAWAAADMPIHVNGQRAAVGKRGTYAVLDRTWHAKDAVTFALPMELRTVLYTGVDQIPAHKRYAILYGPILMAAVATIEETNRVELPNFGKKKNWTHRVRIARDPAEIKAWLKPKTDQPLCFTVEGQAEPQIKPYWQIDKETFTCFPVIEPAEVK